MISNTGNNIDNLLFAGRNISATHIGFASTRVMATCFAIGQGIGTAAAYSVLNEVIPKDLLNVDEHINLIQQRLLRDDAYLIGIPNLDKKDLILKSKISSESEQSNGLAKNIISGQSRAVHGVNGASLDRVVSGTNRWMSKPTDNFPVSIQLEWTDKVMVSEVQIIFDTGMHRVLTLSHSDAYVDKMIWGKPQPETVKDYLLEGFIENEKTFDIGISDNSQRKRIHQLDLPVEIDRILVSVISTNGIDHARINEIRVYSSLDRSF